VRFLGGLKPLASAVFVVWLILGCARDCQDVPTFPEDDLSILFVRPDGTGDYPTIQAAIDAADSGDAIELADGEFRGEGNRDLDYDGKEIIIRSESGTPEACIINCEGTESDPHNGFSFSSGETGTSRLEGVTILEGNRPAGGAVLRTSASLLIVNCLLKENQAWEGGAIGCLGPRHR
jgi:hypothetical protein